MKTLALFVPLFHSAAFAAKFRANLPAALAKRTCKNTRERTATLKGPLRIRRNKQETPQTHPEGRTALLNFCLERLTRLFGAGAPFRPLFYPIPSCIVPGRKIFPSNYIGSNYSQQTTEYKYKSLDCQIFRYMPVENFLRFVPFGTGLAQGRSKSHVETVVIVTQLGNLWFGPSSLSSL